MKITLNGVSLNYEVDGPDGAPWVTFSNSLATNISLWDDQVAELKRDFRILRYDKRGHGGSDPAPGPYSFDMLVGDVLRLWDALDIQTSHFVGLSIGGMTAQGLALEHADRLGKVVISNSRADMPPDAVEAWEQRIQQATEVGMDGMAEPTVERWCSKSFLEANTPALDKMRDMVRSTSLEGYVGCGRALQTLDYVSRLGEITSPTLFIAGQDDIGTPADNMHKMHETVAGSQFVELAPAGHISNYEQPERYNAALREFLTAS